MFQFNFEQNQIPRTYLPLAHISDPFAEPVSIADKVLPLWQEAAVIHFRCLPRRLIYYLQSLLPQYTRFYLQGKRKSMEEKKRNRRQNREERNEMN